MKYAATIFACLLLTVVSTAFAANPRPNIIVILADDLGYETIGANGGQSYATPRLDSLAASGIRFQHGYAQPLCTPTRAQLMTGKYNVRNYDVFGILHAGQVTFANLFHDAGYKTFIGGKWQLQGGYEGPINFGFDEYFLWQLNRRPNRYYAPGFEAYIPADGLTKVQTNYPAGIYGPDVVQEKVLQFIERNQAGPFLVYYTMTLTHDPFVPSPDHPDYNPAVTNEVSNTNYFGSMVEYMDKLVGQLVDRLDQLGLREQTLIFFLGDNGTGGGVTSLWNGQTIKGGKGSTKDAGTHVPFIINWSNTIPAGQVSEGLIDSTDVLPTMCDAAGIPVSQGLDGKSFLAHLRGQAGGPREWSYCWFKPQNGTEADVKEFAQTVSYKLYPSGQFYNTENDLLEQSPLNTGSLGPEAQTAYNLLTNALASFNDARLDRTLGPRPNPSAWSLPPAGIGLGTIAMTAEVGTDINGPAEYQFRNVTLARDSAWQLSPHYVDSGLSDGTSYTYQVRMQDLLANTNAWSDARSASTPNSPNPRVVAIEQPVTDGNGGNQNLGQSFTGTAPYDGWFLDSVTFYAATNSGGGSSAWLTLYDGFTDRTNRGRILSVSANSVTNPRTAATPMIWNFTNVALKAGATYFAALSDAVGGALGAGKGMPTQRMLTNVYDGGSRLNETGPTPTVDLKFSVAVRQFPSYYSQWALGIPEGFPKGFNDAISPAQLLNGWKYFFGLEPLQTNSAPWPRITDGSYCFAFDPKAADVFWRIRYAPALQTPTASWQTADLTATNLLCDPFTGQVQLSLPDWPTAFFRLEIGLH